MSLLLALRKLQIELPCTDMYNDCHYTIEVQYLYRDEIQWGPFRMCENSTHVSFNYMSVTFNSLESIVGTLTSVS